MISCAYMPPRYSYTMICSNTPYFTHFNSPGGALTWVNVVIMNFYDQQWIPWPKFSYFSCITHCCTQKNDRDIQAAESNMAAGHHLESRVYARHPRCLPRFILKLRYPFTHFKRESLCQKNCKWGSEPAPVLELITFKTEWMTQK